MSKYKMYIISIVGMCLLVGCGNSNSIKNLRRELRIGQMKRISF